ncbi:MAG TPA: inorganic phosphate transporter [Thermoanaerobaculia bacterium]|nr:inorganic phosphate transporter [Thermoanaerobaculia bacterium]
MTPIVLGIALATLALAFANGANDNAKGVATLIGAGRLQPRTAVRYATAATLAGSVAAVVLARGLLARFGGHDVLAPELLDQPAFALAVAGAAAGTVLLATRAGLPISTTHALVGGLAGVGLAAGALRGDALIAAFVGPLLLSPLVALAVTATTYPVLRRLRSALGVTHESCVCVAAEPSLSPAPMSGTATARVSLRIVPGQTPRCTGYAGTVLGIDAQRALDGCHLLTAGAVSFARGVNDTPKIAALLLVAAPLGLDGAPALILVGGSMAAGGLLAARRVAATMSHRITSMNDGQAFTANLATAALVLVASRLGVPVSTTHVSVGALFGIGVAGGGARWRTIGVIVLSWVAVLPLAAALAAVTWLGLTS